MPFSLIFCTLGSIYLPVAWFLTQVRLFSVVWFSSLSVNFDWIFFHVPGTAQFSRSVMSDSLRLHGLQDVKLSCPSPTPRAYSNSCPSSRWCHLTISSSVVPFSSRLQSFPASGSFPLSHFFAWGTRIHISINFQVKLCCWTGNILRKPVTYPNTQLLGKKN